MTKEVASFKTSFELKHQAFLVKLLRIFIMAAFSAKQDSYQSASLQRRQSMVSDSENPSEEGSRFMQLKTLLEGPLGESILDQIDYSLLQQKLL